MKRWLIDNSNLLILLTIIGIIIGKNLNFSQYLSGWDNFSTYLSSSTNFFRTIFSTWRSYRGLGSASDSEVVDIIRQLFYFLVSWLPIRIIDQVYVFSTLVLGVLGVNSLIKLITKNSNSVAALIGSLIFLFSFNTVGTYFFPMPMFIARFAFFPWVIYFFIKYLQSTNISNLLYFSIISFIASSSYLTATVFVTLSITLAIISLFHIRQIKKILILTLVFILTNAYWLLPFCNYTFYKSKIIPLSSVFTIVNENQLNESPKHFDWKYLLSMYPNFLQIDAATDPTTSAPVSLHPQINRLNPFASSNWAIFSLVILGTIGSIFSIFSRKMTWARFVPVFILISLFMLRKEYPPIGHIYDLVGEKIPYFKVLFRFGDTKFNNLLALFSALGIGVGISWLLSLSQSKIYRTIMVLPFIVLTLYSYHQFQFFNQGQLISNIVRVNIPQAYFDIAKHINSDPESIRVMHLPNDNLSYFKSHSWGYFGSTFMAFILDKPLFDRAFAPASLENDSVDLKLIELAQNFRNLKDDSAKVERIEKFRRLLATTSTKYLIHDKTITTSNVADNITLWGEFMQEDYDALISYAAEVGVLKQVQKYEIDTMSPFNTIILYQNSRPSLVTQTLSQAQKITSKQDKVLSLALAQDESVYQSQSSSDGAYYPFQQSSSVFVKTELGLEANLDQRIQPGLIKIDSPQPSDRHNFQTYISKNDTSLLVTLMHHPHPFPNSLTPFSYTMEVPLKDVLPYLSTSTSLQNYSTDWHTLPYKNANQLRLSVNGTIIPLPADISTTPEYLTSITTDSPSFELALLAPEKSTKLDSSDFIFTEDPNCFKDKSSGYTHNLVKTQDNINLTTTNGSTCVVRTLPIKKNSPYLEISLNYELSSTDSIAKRILDTPSTYQQQLFDYIKKLPTANYFTACIIDTVSGNCLNNHSTFNMDARSLTLANSIIAKTPPQLLISLPTINTQSAKLALSNMSLSTYKELIKKSVNLDLNYPTAKLTQSVGKITLPKSLSKESYYFNPEIDALRVYNEPCKKESEYRTAKKILPSTTLAYSHNCYSGIYTILPFDSNHFYLWQTNYHLFAGKYPSFMLNSPYNTYLKSYLSWDQGYPNIANARNLQFTNPAYDKELKNINFESTSVFYYPQRGLSEINPRLFTITQNGQNQGILGVNNFNVMELPTSWQNLRIDNTSPDNLRFDPDTTVTLVKSILPSLWQINLESSSTNRSSLSTFLHFSQTHDDQWELFHVNNPLLAILGIGRVSGDHVKVNGLTNGWIIDDPDASGIYYALYTPERLAIVGWAITISSLLVLLLHKLTIFSHTSHKL